MQVKQVKTSELIARTLDWAVAKCEGHEIDSLIGGAVWYWIKDSSGKLEVVEIFNPSSDWAQAGEIIDREIDSLRKRSKAEELSLAYPNPNFKFKAEIFTDDDYFCGFGSTPLIAAMRCYVTSKLGDIVDIPEELI